MLRLSKSKVVYGFIIKMIKSCNTENKTIFQILTFKTYRLLNWKQNLENRILNYFQFKLYMPRLFKRLILFFWLNFEYKRQLDILNED